MSERQSDFQINNSRRSLFIAALALATLGIVLLSWLLWDDSRDFPRIAFVRGWPGGLGSISATLPWLLAVSLALATLPARSALVLAPSLLAFGYAVLGDQNRLQPWVYQFLIVGMGLLFTGPVWGLRLARWFHAGLYFHSGLSKLDWTFSQELGPAFLSVPAGWFGTSPADWPESIRVGLALSMPAVELLLALLLLVPRLRGVGLGLAAIVHLGILAILGPWGLDHGSTVLAWNLALLVEALILFWPSRKAESRPGLEGFPMALRVLFGLVLVLPFFERAGLWDTWPSFAVYASHNERVEVYLNEDDRDFWPEWVAPYVRDDVGQAPWRRVDILGWSRSAVGVPPYPQVRTALGVARSLLAGERPPRSIRVVIQGRADRWTGKRLTETIRSREELDRRLRRHWINAWPSPVGVEPTMSRQRRTNGPQ